ncbi:cell division cycle-associated 7-like protein [Acipenser oxyrinchus oxyrinchus]|uniref:Cell division cycle-associated 7-like protein n=1 Tax=Acipenser oxyrinchus oxyrinchus TaxID=40147 RepID=A0AAD8GF51_ACIOX|nr:cell division cycle-associated 7-like protein [Acipenser oxyrinchus oxyrinchus]
MHVSTKVPEALLQIFETQSDDEDFKGFRNSLPVETSSEDSRDSFQSLDSGKGDLCFRSKYITEELMKIFTEDTDTDDEEFEGFTEGDLELNAWMKFMSMDSGSEEDIGFSSDDEQEIPPKKRVSGLCVAFRFPIKKNVGIPLSKGKNESLKHEEEEEGNRKGKAQAQRQRAVSDSEPEEDHDNAADQPNALQKRAKNIKENKDMLAKLLAELNSMPDLFPMKTPSTTPKRKKSPKKNFSEGQSGRRNPSRRARPPERFGLEGFSMSPTKLMEQLNSISRRAAMRKKLTEVNEEMSSGSPRKRASKHSDQRSVEDITEEELENVAISSKDKLYDKINGSTCHQCRQKTIDSKTVCRNPNCWGVRGQFCGPCLRNRYGEDVRSALLDPLWVCPPCRGVCNCSFCRRRDGRCATGMLIHMAKFYGHSNVKEYLESVQKELSLEK